MGRCATAMPSSLPSGGIARSALGAQRRRRLPSRRARRALRGLPEAWRAIGVDRRGDRRKP
eukprot:5267723-Alexandrium_andersonii.AAC.1